MYADQKELNALNFILLFVTESASAMNTFYDDGLFLMIQRVSNPDLNLGAIDSVFEILSPVTCASYCIDDGCLSFTYTEAEKRCVTFSRAFEEKIDTAVSDSTVFFTKTAEEATTVGPTVSDITVQQTSEEVTSTEQTTKETTTQKTTMVPGINNFTVSQGDTFEVFMDLLDGETWIVIQRHTSSYTSFYRNWQEYKTGFGRLLGDFWIGNDKLHLLTTTPKILRIEMQARDGRTGFVQYSSFQVGDELNKYQLTVTGFSGNFSYDGLAAHNGHAFSTYDVDNDNYGDNCAEFYRGGWWYADCHTSNLNGPYNDYVSSLDTASMSWYENDFILRLTNCIILIR